MEIQHGCDAFKSLIAVGNNKDKAGFYFSLSPWEKKINKRMSLALVFEIIVWLCDSIYLHSKKPGDNRNMQLLL